MVPVWQSGARWWRYWRIIRNRTAASRYRRCCGLISVAGSGFCRAESDIGQIRAPRIRIFLTYFLKTALAADERRLTQMNHAVYAPRLFTLLVGWRIRA